VEKLILLSKFLEKRKFEVKIFETGELAKAGACKILNGHIVGLGNSITLLQIGLPDELSKIAQKVYPRICGGSGENERNSLTSEYYLTSANAISMDGHIVNIDGTGNRVAATCFGPQNVIYFIGKNKIVETLDDALLRARGAAVKLAKKLNRKTPCAVTGKCSDCLSSECLCSITTVHRKKPYGVKIFIFLINENLGI
jgi:hypothetical protein